MSATVSSKAGRWFVSVLVEEEYQKPLNNNPAAGVDLGIKKLAFLFQMEQFLLIPKPYLNSKENSRGNKEPFQELKKDLIIAKKQLLNYKKLISRLALFVLILLIRSLAIWRKPSQS